MIHSPSQGTIYVNVSCKETADYCRLILSKKYNLKFQASPVSSDCIPESYECELIDYDSAAKSDFKISSSILTCLLTKPENNYAAERLFPNEKLFLLPYPFSLQSFDLKFKYNFSNGGEYLKELNLDVRRILGKLIGKSPAMQEIKRKIVTVADTDCSMIFLGKSGTGKTIAAQILHELSPRKNKAFIRIDVASLKPELIEAELFGSVQGAYTGAITRPGLIAAANGGTIFFDEVGNISLELQAKLLHFLETRTYRNVGSEKEKTADVRFVFATNADLKNEVRNGGFREDLYWRIMDFPVRLPALEERKEDLPELISGFLLQFGLLFRMNFSLDPYAEKLLLEYNWPGNVRQLMSCLRRAAVLSRNDGVIGPESISFDTPDGFYDA